MEITNNKIIEILQYLGEKFGVAINWADGNAIPYIEDLIQRIATYEFYSSLAITIIMLILLIICCMFLRYFFKDNTADVELLVPIAIFCSVGIVALPIVCSCEILEMIKAKTLPEVVAIEYLQNRTK